MRNWTALYITIVILLLLTLVSHLHCSVAGPHTTSLGTVSYHSNPYMYEAVNDIAAVANVEGNLNLRVNPVGTYMLYDETILICGLPIDKFTGVTGPFVMTYERQSHRMVDGVGCHNLLRVDNIKEEKVQ